MKRCFPKLKHSFLLQRVTRLVLSVSPAAIDELIGEGRELSDVTVLAAIVLPSLLLQRREIETRNNRPLRRGVLRQMTLDYLAPLVARLSLSRQRSETITEAISIFYRIRRVVAKWR